MVGVRTGRAVVRKLSQPWVEHRERRAKAPLYTSVHGNFDPELHLREAADWLLRAQDYGCDRGVSYGADIGAGFLASYPETTGYIICTFLELARHYGESSYRTRAIEMGEWESAIQMSSGAVMGGMYNAAPTPAVFNTGMVLLGWAALVRDGDSDRFRRSGERAARWLMQMQESNGNWIRGNSEFANPTSTVYNVKAAWGLAEMGVALGIPEFIGAAVRNAEFTLSKQHANGWFADCCLQDSRTPLLHTLAYTMQGLIGIGKITKRTEFVDAADRAARSLIQLMDNEGFIPGQIDEQFKGTVDWCCLTGSAQTSIVWSELERLKGDSAYGKAADRVNRYLMARHDISSKDPSIRGGVTGSWPLWGNYGRYRILNWATRFFVDALLLRMSPEA